MRIHLTLLTLAIVIVAAAAATAKPLRPLNGARNQFEPRNPLLEARGQAALTLSPLALEILRINEESAAAERELLAKLSATQDEDRVAQLVSRLQRLETDRLIAIFKVRIRHARRGGRYDLAFELRHQMLLLLQRGDASLM